MVHKLGQITACGAVEEPNQEKRTNFKLTKGVGNSYDSAQLGAGPWEEPVGEKEIQGENRSKKKDERLRLQPGQICKNDLGRKEGKGVTQKKSTN